MIAHVPRVTIGLAVYNGAKYLAEAIQSILDQTFTDLELVICDNASTDATENICRDFCQRDPRVRYLRSEVNRGAAWNFNRTLDHARGEYFKWHAHDDTIAPTYIARAVEALDRDLDLVLAHSKTSIIDSQGQLVTDASGDLAAWELQGTSPEIEALRLEYVASKRPHTRLEGVLLYSIRCYEVFGLIRTKEMRKTGLYRPYSSGEKVLLADLGLLGAFYEVPQFLSFSRWHAERFSALSSAREQQRHIDPASVKRWRMPRQLRFTWGYLKSIWHSEVSWPERALCLVVLLRFVLRIKKWKSLLLGYVRGMGQTVLPDPTTVPALATEEKQHWNSLSGV
jgi:Glycosyl transferase family 2